MGNKNRLKQKGFSIGELLMVMVILALLGSIGTPAFLAARENAQKNKDISNLNTIRTALQTYYIDRGEYPKSIYACVTGYNGGLQGIPSNKNIQYGLYPRRINTKETFKSEKQEDKVSLDKEDMTLVVAKYPKRPIKKEKEMEKEQCFDFKNGYVNIDFVSGDLLTNIDSDPKATKYYKFSVYDVADVSRLYPDRKKNEYELRYTRFWTKWGLSKGNENDTPRQLGYAYPPEDTVVTWNSYYRKYNGNKPTKDSKDLVLFLSGSVKQISSQTVIDKVWTTLPSDK